MASALFYCLPQEDLQHSLLSSTVADHALLDHQALLVVEVQLHLYLVGVEVRVRVQLYLAVVEVRVRLQA
jgi:hypothetical protein